jgi:hypothetical protein
MIGKNPVTANMQIGGLAFVLLGWLVFFIHPKLVQPKWLRENTWTRAPSATRSRKGKRLG